MVLIGIGIPFASYFFQPLYNNGNIILWSEIYFEVDIDLIRAHIVTRPRELSIFEWAGREIKEIYEKLENPMIEEERRKKREIQVKRWHQEAPELEPDTMITNIYYPFCLTLGFGIILLHGLRLLVIAKVEKEGKDEE